MNTVKMWRQECPQPVIAEGLKAFYDMQLYGRELLPFDASKQNALYVSLDLIGLNSLAGVGWVEILSISEAWHWKPLRGDVGVANITIRTKRERGGRSMGEVLLISSPYWPVSIALTSSASCTRPVWVLPYLSVQSLWQAQTALHLILRLEACIQQFDIWKTVQKIFWVDF